MGMTLLNSPEDRAMTYLLEKGFRQSKTSNWLKPYKEYEPTEEDISNIDLLCTNWDTGGLAGYMISENKAMEFTFIINM